MDTPTEELVRRVAIAENRLSTLEARDRPELISESFLRLPNLRGYWPLNSHRAAGGANDLSGTGLNLSVADNILYVSAGWQTYADFDGAGDYLYRADEAALDILGTEVYIAAADRGLTTGGWFWLDSDATFAGLIGKWTVPGQGSYVLVSDANSNANFSVSLAGAATVKVVSPNNTLSLNKWWFLVGRFTPSTELKLWMDQTTYTLAAGIPASIFNSTSQFRIGYYVGGNYHNGRAALCFLCASILDDDVVEDLFERTRWMFGV